MAAINEKLTPAMKQFHQFKRKYPDCVLFFRMGDFYETFYEDAESRQQAQSIITELLNGDLRV